MQSSPPTRAWNKGPPSVAESDYSVDLAALDLDSHSGASSPLPTKQIDRIASEDIDGPSDFTQNMEKWMRGGSMGKSSIGRGSLGQGTVNNGTIGKSPFRGDLQSLLEIHEEEQNRSVRGDEHKPAAGERPNAEAYARSQSNHTPSDSPPRDSVFEDRAPRQSSAQISSDWDPYGIRSTPQPPPHKQFLQPTVEDYNTEFTPARAQSEGAKSSRTLHDTLPEAVEESPEKSVASMASRLHSEDVSSKHSPAQEISELQHSKIQPSNTTLEQQLQELDHRCKQLEHLNSVLSQRVNDERRARNHDTAKHDAKMADALRRERELRELANQSHSHKEDFKQELAETRTRLRQLEEIQSRHMHGSEQLRRQHAEEMQTMRQNLERQKGEHAEEKRALQQDLEVANRNSEGADETARTHREELEEMQDECDRMKLELQRVDLRHENSELQKALENLEAEKESAHSARQEADDEVKGLRSELALLRQAQDEEALQAVGDGGKGKKLVEQLKAQLSHVRQRLEDEKATHAAEIERLQSELQSLRTARPDDHADLRTELEAKQSELNAATIDRDSAQDDLEQARSDLEVTRQQLADMNSASEALDLKMSESIRKRETYWRGRMEEAEKERRVMAKALLRQWGKEEVGEDEPQGYAYKFVKKNSDAKVSG